MTLTATTLASSETSLASLLGLPTTRPAALAAHLDALAPEERVQQCRALDGRAMARLYELCAGGEPLVLEDFVPAAVAEGETVRFAGKNSLPLFSIFEKHFARVGTEVVGRNLHAMTFATGPGYFTVLPVPGQPKELVFDYTRTPASAPPGWPPARPNESGLVGRVVFGGLHDYNRKVSSDVIIGMATRHGKPINSHYILARL